MFSLTESVKAHYLSHFTMKILKQGEWINPWKGVYACSWPGCGSELELEEKDLQPHGYKHSSLSKRKTAFTCAVCGHENYIPDTALPPRIQEHIESRRSVYDYYD